MIRARPVKMAFEFAQVVVRKHTERRATESRAVNERSVTELVQNDHVAFAAKRAECADRRCVATGETKRGLRAFEFCKRLLQLRVRRERAADEP